MKHDADFRLLDMRFHYTAADVNETFSKLGEDGRTAYRNYWILDFFFIACRDNRNVLIRFASNEAGL